MKSFPLTLLLVGSVAMTCISGISYAAYANADGDYGYQARPLVKPLVKPQARSILHGQDELPFDQRSVAEHRLLATGFPPLYESIDGRVLNHWHDGDLHGTLVDPVDPSRTRHLTEAECEELFGGPGWE
jgi:hypothetical protein